MTYNANIPQPNDFLDESQVDLLSNFTVLDSSFLTNHFNFSDLSGNTGKHRFIEMPVTTLGAISGSLVAGESVLYSATLNSHAQLCYTNGVSTNQYQMTRAIDASFSTFSTFTNYAPAVANRFGGWTFLPGGMLLQYGIADIAANPTATTIAFPVAYTTGVFSITISRITSDTSSTGQDVRVRATSPGLTGFQVVQSSGSSSNQVYWMAIGK